MKRCLCAIIMCLLLPACSPKKDMRSYKSKLDTMHFQTFKERSLRVQNDVTLSKSRRQDKKKRSNSYKKDIIRQQEAKLADVPFLLNSQPLLPFVQENLPDQLSLLGYSSTLSLDDAASFYGHEMERLGWRQIACCEGFESLLYFEKPTRFCSISLRPFKRKKIQIVLVTGNKTLSS